MVVAPDPRKEICRRSPGHGRVRVLVTGTEGQLARSLVRRAENDPDLKLLPVGRPELDLENSGSVRGAIHAARPDVVINAAAYTAVDLAEDEPERARRINGEAAGEIAEAAREIGARVVQISTDYVFDGSAGVAYAEDAPTNPIGAYGSSKLLGEELVRRSNPDHVIIRTAWVYSPFGKNFVKTMLVLARDRDELRVVADQYGNPTNALDLADGILALLRRWQSGSETGLGENYHLAGTGEASWYDLAGHVLGVADQLGEPTASVIPVSTAEFPTKARRPANSKLNSSKFERDFGFAMPGWRGAAEQVVRELAARGLG